MERPYVRQPTPRTLAKYGLSIEEWGEILRRQKYGCGIHGGVPASGILHIEHDHVRGWRTMPPTERKKYVRGLACFVCNTKWVGRGATPTILKAAAKYLENYERRKK